MLNKYNLQIAKILKSVKEECSYSYLKVEENRTIATDSRILIEVTRPEVNKDDFTEIKGYPLIENQPFYLSREEANGLVEILTSSLKKYRFSLIGVSQAVQDKKHITNLIVYNPESSLIGQIKEKDRISYPDIDKIYPEKLPTKIVKLNAKLLKAICEQVIKFSDDSNSVITLILHKESEPVEFFAERKETGQTMKGLLVTIKDE